MEQPKKNSCSCFAFFSKKSNKKVDKGTDPEAIERSSLSNFPGSFIPTDENPFINNSMGSTQKLVSKFPLSNTMTTSLCRTPLMYNLTSSFAHGHENYIKNPEEICNKFNRQPSVTRRSSMPNFILEMNSCENDGGLKYIQFEEKKLQSYENQGLSYKTEIFPRNKSLEALKKEPVQSTETSMIGNKDMGFISGPASQDLQIKLLGVKNKEEDEEGKKIIIEKVEEEKKIEWNSVNFFSDKQNDEKKNKDKEIKGQKEQERVMVITEDPLEFVISPLCISRKAVDLDEKTTKLGSVVEKPREKSISKPVETLIENIGKRVDMDFKLVDQESNSGLKLQDSEAINTQNQIKPSLTGLTSPQSLVKPDEDNSNKKSQGSKSNPSLICPREPPKYMQIPPNIPLESPKAQIQHKLSNENHNKLRKSSSKSPLRSLFLKEKFFEAMSPVQHIFKSPTDRDKTPILKDTAMKCFENLVANKPKFNEKLKPKIPILNLDLLPPKAPIKLSQKSVEREGNKLKEKLLKSLEKSNSTVVVHESVNGTKLSAVFNKELNHSSSEKHFSTLDLILDSKNNPIVSVDQVSPGCYFKRLPSLKISPIKSILSIDDYSDIVSFLKNSPNASKISEKLRIPELPVKSQKKGKLPVLKPITPHYFHKKRSAPQIKNKPKMSVENL
ncbi:hypothetical protein SteCoe_2172 [Stentor coeruleus]|uniref:Uncharacterized protein n=1 Tax=Stentor coeruleus TaxID=5963 RepID=A0A1R2D0B3_9CILI|nr:hypothetical protein SteCoe_2172 [Stentor coeruleus]